LPRVVSARELGEAAYRQGAYGEAIDLLGRHLLTHDRDFRARQLRGLALLRLETAEHLRQAQAELEVADRLQVASGQKPNGVTKASLGSAWHLLGNGDVAKHYYDEALGAGYQSAELFNNLGCIHLLTLRLTDSEACLNQALALDPTLA